MRYHRWWVHEGKEPDPPGAGVRGAQAQFRRSAFLGQGIFDIAQHPTLAEGEQIIAAPTVIKKLPLPLRRFIGDMSHKEKILLGLDLRETGTKPE